jgi:hypothetical protein
MYCHLCATEIIDEEFFCRNCGEPSIPIVAELDKRNWLSSIGVFLLGAALYLLLAVLVVNFLFPWLRGSDTFLYILLWSGALVSGLGLALYKELVGTKKKLRAEREKRRASLSTASRSLQQASGFAEAPASVTEPTTVKMLRR